MWQGMRRRALTGIVVLAGMAAVAPAASAAISPTLSVTTPTPAAAGSTGSLGLDIKFDPTSGSAPDNVTLNLPPGVLANASIDNGQCIKVAVTDFSNDSNCQLGSGTVTALASGVVPIPTNVNFYLTPPPAAGELAGLAVATGAGDQIGSTDGISIRPSGSSDGVGVTLDLTLPDNIDGAPVAVSEIDSTFTGTRYPATCPSTAAAVTMTANTYQSPSTSAPASTSLPVSGCGSLAYNPRYSISAARDAHDKIVAIKTTITQGATESPNSSVALQFPKSLYASLGGLHNLCTAGPASGKCTPVGSVTTTSPDYPNPLTGQAYLTGTLQGLTLTLVFPPPFPLTLVGSVSLKDNLTTFSGLPDIPLTNLTVALDGGVNGLFDTNCAAPTGTSTATLTDQNGDKTAKQSATFTIANCGSSGSGGGSGSGSSGSSGATARPHVSTTSIRGLKSGKPSLRFTLTAARRSNVSSFTVKLPRGLSLRTHKVHRRLEAQGLSLKGAKLKSQYVRRGVLYVTLKKAVRRVTVTVSSKGLKESKALRAAARSRSRKKRLRALRLIVVARNSKGRRTTIHVSTRNLGL